MANGTTNAQTEEVDVNTLETEIAAKQDKLTAGSNITIVDDVISSDPISYTAGNGISINNNVISTKITKYYNGTIATVANITSGNSDITVTLPYTGNTDINYQTIYGTKGNSLTENTESYYALTDYSIIMVNEITYDMSAGNKSTTLNPTTNSSPNYSNCNTCFFCTTAFKPSDYPELTTLFSNLLGKYIISTSTISNLFASYNFYRSSTTQNNHWIYCMLNTTLVESGTYYIYSIDSIKNFYWSNSQVYSDCTLTLPANAPLFNIGDGIPTGGINKQLVACVISEYSNINDSLPTIYAKLSTT